VLATSLEMLTLFCPFLLFPGLSMDQHTGRVEYLAAGSSERSKSQNFIHTFVLGAGLELSEDETSVPKKAYYIAVENFRLLE
jgi:hypothetical protein